MENETEQKEDENKYKVLFETSRDAIMTLEPPTWRFTACNPATVKLFGAKDEAEFISHGPWEVSPEFQPDGMPSSQKAQQMIAKAMDEGTNFFEWTHKKINGKEFPATVLLTRVTLRNTPPFLQATVRDITENKSLEAKLAAHTKELEQKVIERTKELENQLKELERINQYMVGRELRMVELKNEIKNLEGKRATD